MASMTVRESSPWSGDLAAVAPRLLVALLVWAGPVSAVQPDDFSFIQRNNVATRVYVTSEAKQLTGTDGPWPVSVSGGDSPQLSINGGSYATGGSIASGQTLRVRHISAAASATGSTTVVAVGNFSTNFVTVTSDVDRTPDAFSFGTRAPVEPGVRSESTAIMPGGFNAPVAIVPGPGAEYRINGGSATTANGTLQPGQTLSVIHNASAQRYGYTKTYLKVGGVTGYFTTRTQGQAEGAAYPLPVADADGDGVSDANDLCPGTPGGQAVNADGCPVHELSVGRSGEGIVTSTPVGIDCGFDCSESFLEGTQVTLSAVAAEGYQFAGWSDAACPGTTDCSFALDADRSIIATFSAVVFRTLTVSRLGNGLATSTAPDGGINCGSACTKDYPDGTMVSLSATPLAGNVFVGWSGAGCSGVQGCVVTLDADRTVSAEFAPDLPPLSCHAVESLTVAAAPLPGPDLLYRSSPDVAILRHCNGAAQCPFKAAPLMVSGHEKYELGEYVYQDYVFDDFGAETSGGPYTTAFVTSPATGNATPDAANYRSGDILYPNNAARFGDNAADLVEVRIVPQSSEILYRVTLNTLLAKDTTMVVLAWNKDANTTGGSSTLIPTGATTVAQGSHGSSGVSVPGTDEAIFLWNNAAGVGGQHIAYSVTGAGTVTDLSVDIDLASNQMTVAVPRTVHNPVGTAWKYVAMAGLHNGSGTWIAPSQNASATVPGGSGPASPNPPAIFDINNHFAVANGQSGKTGELCHYLDGPCDIVQAIALRQTNGSGAPALTAFARAVSFDALAANTVSSSVPAEGAANPDRKSLVRIFASRIAEPAAEGRERGSEQGSSGGLSGVPTSNRVIFYGPLQMYSLYVPTGYRSNTPAPLTWSHHSLAQFHPQYNGTIFIQEAGEKRGSLVATSNSRSPDGFFVGRNEIDSFEVWADIRRHYNIDPLRSTVTGYSMGGYGTYRQASQYPDLFSRAYGVVGPPGAGIWKGTGGVGSGVGPTASDEYYTLTNYWLENLRNVPFFNMVVETDYLVPIQGPRQQNIGPTSAGDQSLEGLGYRYIYQEFHSGEHLTLFVNDAYPEVKDFLGSEPLDPNPPHVTFSYVPDSNYTLMATSDGEPITLKRDHAYWVSKLVLRNAAPAVVTNKSAKGTIDVRSLAFGKADPVAPAQTTTPGTLPSGNLVTPLAFTEYKRTWAAPLAVPTQNRLELTLTNLSDVNIDLARASINTAQEIVISSNSDGATVLQLGGSIEDYAGRIVYEDGVPLCTAKLGPGGAQLPVKAGSHLYRIAAAPN